MLKEDAKDEESIDAEARYPEKQPARRFQRSPTSDPCRGSLPMLPIDHERFAQMRLVRFKDEAQEIRLQLPAIDRMHVCDKGAVRLAEFRGERGLRGWA